MKKIKIKQGTLAWEKARQTRIGSSEVFDIVRYYATDEELQNCGINAEDFKGEAPYTSVWALYHKILNDGLYYREVLEAEYAEYGHAVEPYGVYTLQKNRSKKLKPGEVYVNEQLIASLDISGITEECDLVPFAYGTGTPKLGQKFVCEQKTMLPLIYKRGIPFKYIVQAQYQITMTGADYYILQLMVLKEDTPFIRGRICQMSRKTRYKYLDENMDVKHIYFKNNKHLAQLIKTCLDRFFKAVEQKDEPMPYIETDGQQHIIECIRQNSLYNDKAIIDMDLTLFDEIKTREQEIESRKKEQMQKIVELAKTNNACRYRSPDGATAYFSKNGRFLFKPAEVAK